MNIIKDNEITLPYIYDLLQNPEWAQWRNELEVVKRFLEKAAKFAAKHQLSLTSSSPIDWGSPVIAHIYGQLYPNTGVSSHAIVICGYEATSSLSEIRLREVHPGSVPAEHVMRLVQQQPHRPHHRWAAD